MLDREYSSMEEIDKVFSQHLESLRLSGVPFDEKGTIEQWAVALANYKAGNRPPWLNSNL